MIQEQTRLKVADNSGARSVMCIRVLGTKSKVARVGDVIRVTVKEALPNSNVKKGDLAPIRERLAVVLDAYGRAAGGFRRLAARRLPDRRSR